MKRNLLRSGAVGGAAALVLAAAAPGYAATVVAEATAAAVEISVAGEGSDSGRVVARVTDDGETTTTGETNPAIGVLDGQELLNIGALVQEATAELDGRAGVSAACSGVAGPGDAVAEVGENSCIAPRQPIDVSIANLDLTGTQLVDEDSALAPLGPVGEPLFEQLIGPVTAAVSEALSQLGTVALGGTLGALEARCEAEPGVATGDATLLNSRLTADVNGNEVVLLDFPANPEPNTKVVTDLDKVVNLLLDGLRTDLRNSLQGELDPVGEELIAPIQENLVNTIVKDVSDQLQPLEDNFLSATLNKQISTGDRISVTALDLTVLPGAAESPLAAPLVEAALANVTCGPNARVGEAQEPDANQPGTPAQPAQPAGNPVVPTVVDSGVGGQQGADGGLLVGGLLALTGVAGVVGYRTVLR